MSYLIDGHNLIGTEVFADIQLADTDDEWKLVQRLRAWRSRLAGDVTVIFDRGITEGLSRELSGGGVEVRFARNPTDADELILRRIKRAASDLMVVTRDRRIRDEAARRGVRVLDPFDFVEQMQEAPDEPEVDAHAAPVDPGAAADVELSAQEVEELASLFSAQRDRPGADRFWRPPSEEPVQKWDPFKSSRERRAQQEEARRDKKSNKRRNS